MTTAIIMDLRPWTQAVKASRDGEDPAPHGEGDRHGAAGERRPEERDVGVRVADDLSLSSALALPVASTPGEVDAREADEEDARDRARDR